MRARSVWTASLLATALVAASCNTDDRPSSRRPGFALAGSVDSNYDIHLYRTTLPPTTQRGIVIRFHPRAGSAFRLQDDISLPVEAIVICAHAVGFDDTKRAAGSCRKVATGEEFALDHSGSEHVAVELLAPGKDSVFIPEFVVGYDPVDGFLAIEFAAAS